MTILQTASLCCWFVGRKFTHLHEAVISLPDTTEQLRKLGNVLFHKYTNTQKSVFLLYEGFLPSQPSFVYLLRKKGDFFGPIHGYAYKMTNFLFVYLFFIICSTNRRPNICLFLGYQKIHRC
jgi:hypothetical protein